ncbi:Crp/Fnr family transcriptional regulator [Pseudoalteromonas luteoviolacea]|uniref:Crp/Fnr family transcriptional regulator n=1 Tax=Pseudoalteromonas luteoviolacea TaxID=43657 RepID=UPI00114E47D3|nr:Crp/Fnr family transcriptional regulator [Pseudoalteromonas luteoviolacea]TQF70794.1 Crp/Fnr family transcriptional regulator [Pseudoalteromonas luteoviolacea]
MELQKLIASHGTQCQVDKGTRIFNQGDNCDYVYWVESGLLKAFYVTANGKETIKSFIKQDSIIGSLNAAYCQVPCTFSLETLEPSLLVQIPFKKLLEASKDSVVISQDIIRVLLGLALKKERREFELLTLSATERFNNLSNDDPQLVARLTQNDIAKYLGITPVALSRIKHQ